MPVLITAGLSPEAYRLNRILNITEVVFADDKPLPQFPGSTNLLIPSSESPSFVHEILKTCIDLEISKVFPLKFGEVIELAKARYLFAEYNVALVIPSDVWLSNYINTQALKGKAGVITVLVEGRLFAGDALHENFLLNNETGIFWRETTRQKIEYSLYLVNDAGI